MQMELLAQSSDRQDNITVHWSLVSVLRYFNNTENMLLLQLKFEENVMFF